MLQGRACENRVITCPLFPGMELCCPSWLCPQRDFYLGNKGFEVFVLQFLAEAGLVNGIRELGFRVARTRVGPSEPDSFGQCLAVRPG